MRILYTFLGIILFFLLLGFVFKNAEPVSLHYYLGYYWQAPLSLMLFITLIVGIVIGLLALIPSFVRQKKQIQVLKNEIVAIKKNQ